MDPEQADRIASIEAKLAQLPFGPGERFYTGQLAPYWATNAAFLNGLADLLHEDLPWLIARLREAQDDRPAT